MNSVADLPVFIEQLCRTIQDSAFASRNGNFPLVLGHIADYRPRSVNGRGSAPTGPSLGLEIDTSPLGKPLFSAQA
jgi:hypothetical protein